MNLGGASIDQAVVDFLKGYLDEGLTILELGSGTGTAELAKTWTMHSIEHDREYLNLHDSHYIHAPLVPHKAVAHYEEPRNPVWYNARILEVELPKIDYDLILVDGPPGQRSGFVKYYSIFKQDVPILFDDANLARNIKVMRSISSRTRRPFTVHNSWADEKDFGVIHGGSKS